MHLDIFGGKCLSSMKKCIFISFSFLYSFCEFFEVIFDYTCALADQSLYAGILYEHYCHRCPGWPCAIVYTLIHLAAHYYAYSLSTLRYRHYIVDCHLVNSYWTTMYPASDINNTKFPRNVRRVITMYPASDINNTKFPRNVRRVMAITSDYESSDPGSIPSWVHFFLFSCLAPFTMYQKIALGLHRNSINGMPIINYFLLHLLS
jgi:hypothetical protein